MNSLFHDEIDKCVIVYTDYILVYSNIQENHERDLRKILGKLKKHKFLANVKKGKSFFWVLEFLEHVLVDEGIHPDPKKIQVICVWVMLQM